jgi:hypothetical protein
VLERPSNKRAALLQPAIKKTAGFPLFPTAFLNTPKKQEPRAVLLVCFAGVELCIPPVRYFRQGSGLELNRQLGPFQNGTAPLGN